MVRKEMIAMLLAGGQGSRLGVLTSDVANRQCPLAGISYHRFSAEQLHQFRN